VGLNLPRQGSPHVGSGARALEPALAGSARSLLQVGRLVSLAIGLVAALDAAMAWYASTGSDFPSTVYPSIAFAFCMLLFVQLGRIGRDLEARRYVRAKERLLVWTVLGLVFGYVIAGLVPLTVWLILDPLIDSQRSLAPNRYASAGSVFRSDDTPTPYSTVRRSESPERAALPPPPASPPAPLSPACGCCGEPASWIAQYARWYCFADGEYL
jgi:hypothetical protein